MKMAFHKNFQKSRLYFVALAKSTKMFEKLPLSAGDRHEVPYISHWQSEVGIVSKQKLLGDGSAFNSLVMVLLKTNQTRGLLPWLAADH